MLVIYSVLAIEWWSAISFQIVGHGIEKNLIKKIAKTARRFFNLKLNNKIQRSGILFVISSPSGAGKTTLARKLIEIDYNIQLSISVTTRSPRKITRRVGKSCDRH